MVETGNNMENKNEFAVDCWAVGVSEAADWFTTPRLVWWRERVVHHVYQTFMGCARHCAARQTWSDIWSCVPAPSCQIGITLSCFPLLDRTNKQTPQHVLLELKTLPTSRCPSWLQTWVSLHVREHSQDFCPVGGSTPNKWQLTFLILLGLWLSVT